MTSGAVRELAQPEAGRTDVRMNDGACDPQGRFWAGTMAYDEAPGAGCLYRLELDGSCTRVLAGLTISNGIGWSPDGTTMYLADSGTGDIDAFDFDRATGDLAAAARSCTSPSERGPGRADGRHQGNIWVALWNGGALARYGPDGSLLEPSRSRSTGLHRARSAVPAAGPCSSPPPGKGWTTAALTRQPDAGRLLRLDNPGATGPPCVPYRGRLVPV